VVRSAQRRAYSGAPSGCVPHRGSRSASLMPMTRCLWGGRRRNALGEHVADQHLPSPRNGP
jgi:hypothetical protein